MKNFETILFLYQLFYNNNVKLVNEKEKNIIINITNDEGQLNIDNKTLISILSYLLYGDVKENEKIYSVIDVNINGFNDYIEESKNITENIQQDLMFFEGVTIDDKTINLIMNYAYKFLKSITYENDIKHIINNTIHINDNEYKNYSKYPIMFNIISLYKNINLCQNEMELITKTIGNIKEQREVYKKITETIEMLEKEGKSATEIDNYVKKLTPKKEDLNDKQ